MFIQGNLGGGQRWVRCEDAFQTTVHRPQGQWAVVQFSKLWWFVAGQIFSGLVMLLMGCAFLLFFGPVEQVRE
jgi:hypothetical protein